jgi:hypothetical protein
VSKELIAGILDHPFPTGSARNWDYGVLAPAAITWQVIGALTGSGDAVTTPADEGRAASEGTEIMKTVETAVDTFIAAWNEADELKRFDLLAEALTDDVRFADPLLEGTGYAPISALIGQLQAQLPGGALQRTGEIATHHNLVRFHWEAGFPGQPAVIAGTDTAEIAPDGRLQSIASFFDVVPAGMLG